MKTTLTGKTLRKFAIAALFSLTSTALVAQNAGENAAQPDTMQSALKEEKKEEKKVEKKWFDNMSIRGYAQIRYNQLLVSNPELINEQGDKSIGTKNGFFIRRARIIFSGRPNEHVSFYFQPDLASSIDANRQYYAQIRDLYFDVSIDKEMVYRFRIGQSKVPFGFENLQSSSNRLALDRADAQNSALSNERDLGVFFYYTPKSVTETFTELQNSKMKGSGNYGMFAIGAYNGQTAGNQEMNSKRHYVTRLAYPAKIGSQIFEAGAHAYFGDFVLLKKDSKIKGENEFRDQRVGANFILYPKPFGIQAEWNMGLGPEFDPSSKTIFEQELNGYYVQAMYNLEFGKQLIIPFVKYQYYDGGKKHEQDARSYTVKDTEIGIEWQPVRAFELTAIYAMMDRRYEDFAKPVNHQKGNLLRLQAQVNF